MSIEIPGELLTRSSGSAGDLVHSHNQHGRYVRARTPPTDPASARQLAVRAAMTECVTAWNNTLTQTERETWERYALAVPLPGPLGRRTHAGGVAMYVRSNVPRLQASELTLPRVDVAPTRHDLGSPSPLQAIILNVVMNRLHVFFNVDDEWATDVGSALLFYVSEAQPLTRNFWAGPYSYANPILARAYPHQSSPRTVRTRHLYAPGNRCFVRYRCTSTDGRLSAARRLPADHLPQVPPVPIQVTFRSALPWLWVYVKFDHLMEPPAPFTAPWSIRYLNFDYLVNLCVMTADTLMIIALRKLPDAGPDQVTYAPVFPQVKALCTSIALAAFTRPIPWP